LRAAANGPSGSALSGAGTGDNNAAGLHGMSDKHPRVRSFGRNILVGLITVAPLGITWFILDFLFGQLSRIGRPWVTGMARAIRPQYPDLAAWLLDETLQSIAAVLVVLAFLYLLGWATTVVVGRRLIDLFESLIGRIPLVDTIYRSTKRFLNVASATPGGERRVVLIDFPSRQMKTLGLVTRTMTDAATGEELAAVYVPTAPNPTSGYIEIVPMRDVTFIDWTFDQAMAFIVTGGSSAPETIAYSKAEGAAGTDATSASLHLSPLAGRGRSPSGAKDSG
jgi:uncharacterized membrane protein